MVKMIVIVTMNRSVVKMTTSTTMKACSRPKPVESSPEDDIYGNPNCQPGTLEVLNADNKGVENAVLNGIFVPSDMILALHS